MSRSRTLKQRRYLSGWRIDGEVVFVANEEQNWLRLNVVARGGRKLMPGVE
jgi:hypothetical protein